MKVKRKICWFLDWSRTPIFVWAKKVCPFSVFTHYGLYVNSTYCVSRFSAAVSSICINAVKISISREQKETHLTTYFFLISDTVMSGEVVGLNGCGQNVPEKVKQNGHTETNGRTYRYVKAGRDIVTTSKTGKGFH